MVNNLGYVTMNFIANKYNLTLTLLHSGAYVIPQIILIEPRICYTYVHFLFYKKLIYLNIMLQSLKTYDNPQILQKISQFHQQICQTIIQLQQCLKVQILLIYIKTFLDALAAFYAIMKSNDNWKTSQYLFCGILAVFHLILLTYPIGKILEMVSKNQLSVCKIYLCKN